MPNCSIRHPLAAAAGLAAALTITACGNSGGSATTRSTPAGGSTSPAANRGTNRGPNRGPAASGTIAAISGRTMQVQNQQSGQVAVRWTSSTAFTHEVQVSATKVVVGSCVVATGSSSASASSFTAARVVLSTPTGGRCGGELSAGDRPAGGPTGQPPSGFPTDRPSGARRTNVGGGQRTGSFAAGRVTARSGTAVTVTMPGFGSSSSSTKRTVLLGASTKVYEQARTTAKSLAVGRCATAQGKVDSSGAVTATRVQITASSHGSCTTTFGRVGSGG